MSGNGSMIAMASGRVSARCSFGIYAFMLIAALAAAPHASMASTITLGVTGLGLDQGELCLTTASSCPGSPSFSWSTGGGGLVSGDFVYNSTAGTASFSLVLTTNASFGGETLLAGSTFSGAGVQVTSTSLGGGLSEITQSGAPINGTANLLWNPGLAMIQGAPAISGLSCTLGAASDVCGVSLGAGGLVVGPDANGNNYNGFLTFDVTTVPVPLPASAWLLLSGLALLARRARAA
jgi:hypothetical protein